MQEESRSWRLQGSFKQHKLKDEVYDLVLEQAGLRVTTRSNTKGVNSKTTLLDSSDLVGCVCMKSERGNPGHVAFFTVYSYVLKSKGGGKKRRIRTTFTFQVDDESSFSENLSIANKWRIAVYCTIRGVHLHSLQGHQSQEALVSQRKLLVLVNPNSGPGKAEHIYNKQVAPVLGEAEIPHQVVITKQANHAKELVKNADLNKYAGIVIVSGDGLIYEVYNGLMERSDWESAITIPLGVIPGGSGNGLARSIAHWLKEPYLENPVLVSTLNIVYARPSPMDLVLIETQQEQKLISFLSVGIGLLSDIDIESERLRAIGEARFTVWAFARIANLRKYHAKVSFKRAEVDNGTSPRIITRPPLKRSQTVDEQSKKDLQKQDRPPTLSHSVSTFEAQEGDTSSLTQINSDSYNSLTRVVDSETEPANEPTASRREIEHGIEALEKTASPAKDSRLKLSDPLPDDWETIEDEFVMVYAAYQTHIGSDICFAPKAEPNDGVIWLLMFSSKATRVNILKFLIGMENGSHVNIPGVDMVAVQSLRFVPCTNNGHLTIDGEKMDYQAFQATILPKKGTIMTRNMSNYSQQSAILDSSAHTNIIYGIVVAVVVLFISFFIGFFYEKNIF